MANSKREIYWRDNVILQCTAHDAEEMSQQTMLPLCSSSCLFFYAARQIAICSHTAGWHYDTLALFCVDKEEDTERGRHYCDAAQFLPVRG